MLGSEEIFKKISSDPDTSATKNRIDFMALQPPENTFHLLGLLIGGDLGPFTFYKSQRRLTVWFDKAPPLSPPTDLQTAQRNRFRSAAAWWKRLSNHQRREYELASQRASLRITGYNLFVHFKLTRDQAALETLERRTNTVLA